MRKLVNRILVLLIFLVIIDFVIGQILFQVLVNSPDGIYYKAHVGLNKCTADVIIFGSSRAEENYVPFVIEDSLNLSCWNAGRGGQSLPYWIALSKGILNRYSPKVAIINMDSYLLSLDMTDWYERAGTLRPFYYKNPEIRMEINNISRFEKLYLSSRLYAYNSSFYYLFRPYLIPGIDGKPEHKGWKPRHGIVRENNTILRVIHSQDPLNPKTVKLFEEFIGNLTGSGCSVYVVVSPDYYQTIESTSTTRYLENIPSITLINLAEDQLFSMNKNFYVDPTHMNIDGAIEFSKRLSSKIIDHKRIREELMAESTIPLDFVAKD